VTGSSYIPIVVPIMAFVAMGAWLGMIFYAAEHPGYRRARSKAAVTGDATGRDAASSPAAGGKHEALPDSGGVGPLDHERIDETTSGALSR